LLASQSPNLGAVMLLITLISVSVILYFLPSALAMYFRHPAVGRIILVNVFLGWTLLGWIVSLAWVLTGNHCKHQGYSSARSIPDRYGSPDFSNLENWEA
jgi:hypothetical protein